MSPRRAVALLLLAALVAVATGCGSVARTPEGEGSAANGKELFQGECGGCHTLADAGTQSEIGPNLDHAFDVLRASSDGGGFNDDVESTIRDVVRGQIAYPTENPAGLDEEGKPFVGMPADIVTGQDAADVAAYVASVTGLPVEDGQDGGQAMGAEALFTQNCASCHVLAAAGASGQIGPSLDALQPDVERVLTAMRQGPGQMPVFADRLDEAQLQELAEYVADSAG